MTSTVCLKRMFLWSSKVLDIFPTQCQTLIFCILETDPEKLGSTLGDLLYHHGAEIGFPLNKAVFVPTLSESDDNDVESEDDAPESSTSGKRKRGA